ncbi:MAG: hypothetical protein K8R54_16715 [Bacteroidales bacterium]|nr:hypothetical protein [Bacteroidales bacterium]
MKTTNKPKSIFLLLLITFLCINLSCKKNDDMVPDQILKNNYSGTLTVRNTNTYPEWDETAQVDVTIDKDGLVTFGNTSLTYSGEKIIDDDSKIVRSGSWTIYPTGILEQHNDIIYIQVDAGVSVVNDVQQVYEKDDLGNWILLYEVNYTGNPNSDLSFIFDDAETGGGSTCGITADTGSIIWTLLLTVTLD